MPEAGLSLTDQATTGPFAATLDGTAPSAVWRDLADTLEPAIRDAVRTLLARDGPTHHADRADALLEAGLTAETDATAHALATVFAGYDRAPDSAAYEAARTLLRAFGQPEVADPLGWHVPLSAVGDGLLVLLGAVDATPTVSIHLREAFFDQRADQRRDICQLLATLSRVADVRLLATGRQQRKLKAMHRPDLPGVSDWCNHPQDCGPLAAVVETALVSLDPDGRGVRLLRALAAEPGETLAYSELYAEAPEVTTSRVKQCLGRLVDLDLVATFGPDAEKKAELLAAGREFLDALDAELGRQVTLEDAATRVRKSGQSSPQAVLSDEHGRGDGSAGDTTAAGSASTEGSAPYRTRWLSRPAHAAAVGTAGSAVVTLAPDRLGGSPDELDHRRYVSFDAGPEKAVVAIQTTTPMQYVVSLALALASPRFLDAALSPSQLEAVEDPPSILRDARCIGALSDEAAADPSILRDELVEWGEELATLTRKDHRDDCEDRAALRSDIMQSAHGLAGSIVHLLDVVGVDLVRELRVPPGLDADHRAALARSVAHSVAIQSRYGAFAAYRQLYEEREDKRRAALSPEVDAADPLGDLIGQFVIRGPDVDRLRSYLERALADPADVHEDAPEFGIEIPVREAGREAIAKTAERVLSRKRLRPMSAAVSVLHGLVSSPYEVAEVLHQLGDARYPRDVRPAELRYALATLDAEALLPDAPPSAGEILATLLRAERRLSAADLAARAEVSPRSLRRHRDVLEALDVVDVTADAPEAGGGWRLTLSFRTEAERLEGRLPEPASGAGTLADVVSDVAAALLPPEEYHDPGGLVDKSLSWPPDPWALVEDSRLEPWVRLAARLVGVDPPTAERTVRMGPELEQAPLPTDVTATEDATHA